jgi:predicted CXXCH cytochrome family protein
VAANACENCHRPHTAGGAKWLMNEAAEENNCYSCHNANVALKNVQSEFTSKPYRHPVATTTGVHDPAEANIITTRHVECVDCHNPHAATAGPGTPSGPLAGVRGVTGSGADVNPSTSEYQICFRCHGDSPGMPASRTARQIAQTNTRLEFQTTNPSYHPIMGAGKSTNVPSLISPWTTSSTMKCTDCHNNNTGPGAGGTGPAGPHGSIYTPLLERQYAVADNTPHSDAAYALCYKCHSRVSILSDVSFREHSKHISGESAPCNVCHDPHGISGTQGNAVNNSRLINFDTTIVRPSSSGALRFESTGTNRGRCYLTCHGTNHNPLSY